MCACASFMCATTIYVCHYHLCVCVCVCVCSNCSQLLSFTVVHLCDQKDGKEIGSKTACVCIVLCCGLRLAMTYWRTQSMDI